MRPTLELIVCQQGLRRPAEKTIEWPGRHGVTRGPGRFNICDFDDVLASRGVVAKRHAVSSPETEHRNPERARGRDFLFRADRTAWMRKTTRMDRRLIVEPIAHSTSDGHDPSQRRGSSESHRTVEFREKKVSIRIAALIRSKTKSDETIEVVGWKRNRRKFPNSAHSDTSQHDRSARPSRAEWLTAQPVRDLRVEKDEVLEIIPGAGRALSGRPGARA
ncbi:hypothetical protein BK022_04335 [Methylorubrum extorquens]|uniref:Uncharacterized protein n=1 Tax=Methylorubrum extorquens TaxID=408 RepID=A0A1S1P8L2_METEX|nr:hypothetical protein BK022_04335 [Methylorubrum extorquens]